MFLARQLSVKVVVVPDGGGRKERAKYGPLTWYLKVDERRTRLGSIPQTVGERRHEFHLQVALLSVCVHVRQTVRKEVELRQQIALTILLLYAQEQNQQQEFLFFFFLRPNQISV